MDYSRKIDETVEKLTQDERNAIEKALSEAEDEIKRTYLTIKILRENGLRLNENQRW